MGKNRLMNQKEMSIYLLALAFAFFLAACSATQRQQNSPSVTISPMETKEVSEQPNLRRFADVLEVSVSGKPGSYQFSVTIQSPDLGCNQYADWWEVLDESGTLLYRRILAHSHVTEQPFTRSGGSVEINPAEIVLIRAHMHPGGYGGTAMRGSVAGGFSPLILPPEFASELENTPPLPENCAF